MSEGKVIAAVVAGDARVLADLLTAGGDVDEQDEQGWTPLAWPAGRGDTEAVKLLLAHGGDVTLTGRDNRTPRLRPPGLQGDTVDVARRGRRLRSGHSGVERLL